MLEYEQVLAKSSKKLLGLHPTIELTARQLIKECYALGIYIMINQGLRTMAEQKKLYAQGRPAYGGNKGDPIVTNAKAGDSFHNYGLAIDFNLISDDGKTIIWDTKRDRNLDRLPDWDQVVTLAKKKNFKWGGDWKTFKDMPHFEMTFGFTIKDLKAGKRPATNPNGAETYFPAEGEKRVNKVDANKIIDTYLKPAYGKATTAAERIEIGRLADELRKASGQPTQN